MSSFPEGVEADALAHWMDEQGLEAGAFEGLQVLTGGTQNIMLLFSRGAKRFVLRRPPLHKRRNSDATMAREARVLGAIANTPVPHPRLIAACDDTEVLGAAFYLMEPIDGFNPVEGLPSLHAESPEIQNEMGLSMATALAQLGEVDYLAAGLEGFGKPDGYLERQVDRWQGQLDSYSSFEGYPGHDIPGVKEVAAWLTRNLPSGYRPGIVHGDCHAANVMFRKDGPGLAALVDWELATVGDPLLDLGALVAFQTSSQDEESVLPVWPHFPSRSEVLARYAEHSTRKLEALEWYEILACYRLGIILEGTRARAFAGMAPEDCARFLRDKTLLLFENALRKLRGTA